MHSFLDGFTRFVMLVLAGMVSLSILGAIAAMSNGEGGPRGFMIDSASQPVPTQPGSAPPSAAQAGPAAPRENAQTGPAATVVAAAPEPTDWSEVIAYALLAIAGILALVALILWRLFGEARRAAEALEALAAQRGPR